MKDKKMNTYKIPDGYFETLQSRVEERLRSEPKTDGMQVPNQYFESLPDRVLALVDEPTLQVVHKRAGVPRWLMGVASMLVLAITAIAVWPEQSDTELSADVVDIDVEALLDAADLEDELSLQQLVAFLEVEEIDAVATEGVYEDLSLPILEAADLEELEDLL